MLERRLDDRIRSLSVEMVGAPKDELERILQELLSAIHEKMERLRSLAATGFSAASIPKNGALRSLRGACATQSKIFCR